MNGENQIPFNMLNQITKVAAIKATGALSKMLEFPIGVDILPVEIKSLEQLKSIMQKEERVVGLNVPITGPLSGTFLLIYPEKSAFSICDAMFHRTAGETKQFSKMEISALTEVANIVIGNFLTSFAVPLEVESLLHRAAHFSYDQFSTFMDGVALLLYKNINDGMVIELAFHFRHIKIHGLAVFLFDKTKMIDLIEKVNI